MTNVSLFTYFLLVSRLFGDFRIDLLYKRIFKHAIVAKGITLATKLLTG